MGLCILKVRTGQPVRIVVPPSTETRTILVHGPENFDARLGFEGPPDVEFHRSDAKSVEPRERVASASGNRPRIVSQ